MTDEQLALIEVDPGVTPDVLAKVLPAIQKLVTESIDPDYEAERVIQLLRLERADAFDRGIQNIAPNIDNNGIVTLTTFGVQTGNQQQTGSRALDYNPRKTRSYRDKFVSTLGGRPFYNTSAEPNDPTNENDRRGARQVNLLLQKFAGERDLRGINDRLAFYLFKHGTTLGHVRTVTDGKRFGFTSVPNVSPGQQCLDCNQTAPTPGPECASCGSPNVATVPVQGAPSEVPNSSVELTLLNGYFYSIPFSVQVFKESPRLILECEKHKGAIMRAHPNARKLVGKSGGSPFGGDGASDATGVMVRSSAQSQFGAPRAWNDNIWGYRQNYISPDDMELIEEDTARALVHSLYPDGLKLVRAAGVPIVLKREDFRERFCACLPSMSDYVFADGISWGMFGLDDFYSNMLNIAADTFECAIARWLLNPDYFDAKSMNQLRYSPEMFIEGIPKAGEGFSNAAYKLQGDDPSQALAPFMVVVDELIQQMLGLPEQLWGAMPPNLTLGQARMMLTQGLMQLGTVANNMTHFYEEADTNSVNLYIKTAKSNPSFGGQTIDLDLIRNSSWTIKGGTVMPRTFAERQADLLQMITNNPQLTTNLKIFDPVNFEAMTAYLDLPDLENPDLEAAEAIRDVIDQLWNGAPIQQSAQPDPTTGLPGPTPPPQPSIPLDPVVFPPAIVVSLCQSALLKGQSRALTPGYANVRAYLMAAKQAAVPPPPPMPPPKLSMTLALDKAPSEQEMAVLQKYGIDFPPNAGPSLDTINKMDVAVHQHQLKPAHEQAGLPPPGDPLTPGAPSMMPPGAPTGMDTGGLPLQ
jgi:hypothetical protein